MPERTRELTQPQRRMLERVVKTNGGGVSVYSVQGADRTVLLRLHEMGLVQGKKGQGEVAVHTPEGLRLIREQPHA